MADGTRFFAGVAGARVTNHVPVPFRYNITVSYREFCIILNSDSVFSRIRNYSIEFTRNSCVEATYAHIIVGTPRESYCYIV